MQVFRISDDELTPRSFPMIYRYKFSCLLPLACLLLAGCSSPERDMLIGQWQIEKAGKILNRLANDQSESADKNHVDNGAGQMLLGFHASGELQTITQMGAIDRQNAESWELLEYNRAAQTSQIRCVLNGQSTEHPIEWLTNGNLKMVPPNMAGTLTKLEFCRVE